MQGSELRGRMIAVKSRRTRPTMLRAIDVAAYLLDRADQYVTDSACWVALSDAAHNIYIGEVETAKRNGDLDDSLYRRLKRMTRGDARPVDPTAGVDDD